MKAILSVTPNDLYLFNLPFAAYSWHKVGADCIIITPQLPRHDPWERRYHLVSRMLRTVSPKYQWYAFNCQKDKEATYAQCGRLYAAASASIDDKEVLITGDADMCVFDREYWAEDAIGSEEFHVIGCDLVPPEQFPMCYIAARASEWRSAFHIGNRAPQECLDDLLGHIEAENFRGNYWGKDQEEAYIQISKYWKENKGVLYRHPRAISRDLPLATRRADRDGWPDPLPLDIIDAHLPRPGYLPENFAKIRKLFQTMYPADDLTWMDDYRNAYTNLHA